MIEPIAHPPVEESPPARLAALDIGSNSVRCIVVEIDARGQYRTLDDEKAVVRLGEGLEQSGEISPAAWERTLEALARMRKIADGYQVGAIEAVATSAVRRAANGEAFLEAVEAATGIRVRVISGAEEARLAALSAWHNFAVDRSRYALVDIGGGSLEVALAAGVHFEEVVSLDLGAVVLTERFLPSDPVADKEFAALRRHVRGELKRAFASRPKVPCIIGSGGTVTSIAGMAMALEDEKFLSVHRHEVLRSQVVHLLAMLVRKNRRARRSIPGLNPDRADIIVAGVAVIDELMRFLGANTLRVNDRGIREGLILDSLGRHGLLPEQGLPKDWRSGVEQLARACRVDLEHARQVDGLSRRIFAQVAGPFGLDQRAAELLEAAALLHDIGYFISYAQHHKHSYHLIRHANLFGFTPRERELIANVARYHRKALPKKKHDNYLHLSPADRLLVERLGGILRLADGLDRRRSGQVRDLECRLEKGRFLVTLAGDDDLSVERHGASVKGDLFAAAFRVELVLEQA